MRAVAAEAASSRISSGNGRTAAAPSMQVQSVTYPEEETAAPAASHNGSSDAAAQTAADIKSGFGSSDDDDEILNLDLI